MESTGLELYTSQLSVYFKGCGGGLFKIIYVTENYWDFYHNAQTGAVYRTIDVLVNSKLSFQIQKNSLKSKIYISLWSSDIGQALM